MLTNSWIIVERATNKPVFETWVRKVADHVNHDKYDVYTAHEWLAKLNQQARSQP